MKEKPPVKRINNTKHVTADRLAYERIRYQNMVEAGICPTCSKTKDNDGFVICMKCRKKGQKYVVSKEKQLKYNRTYYQKRVKNGLCANCGKRPPAVDRKLCQECLDEAKNYQRNRLSLVEIC